MDPSCIVRARAHVSDVEFNDAARARSNLIR